jgi:hypothetical protein
MGVLFLIHRILGEMILPLAIIVAAIWLTVSWKPNAQPNAVARLFPVLVDIQVLLGIIYWVFGIVQGNPRYLSFPFILHPIIGLLAAGFAHRALSGSMFRGLGRYAPLAALAVLLVLVLVNVALARMA